MTIKHTRIAGLAGVLGLSVIAGLPHSAQAQDAVYLNQNASHCAIFEALSDVLPAECAQENAAPRTRSITSGVKTRQIVPRTQAPAPAPAQSVAAVPAEPAPAPAPAPEESAVAAAPADPAPAPSASEQSGRRLAFQIQFEVNSAAVLYESEAVLDRLAEVLRDPIMADAVLRIEGHADSSGPASYNMQLSQQRAEAVRDYLVAKHGLQAQRLVPIGLGESRPYDQGRPAAPVNRRVEFVNLSG